MLEIEREKLNELNKELMCANTEYEELKERLEGLGTKIFELKKTIDDIYNGEQKES